MKDDGSDGVSIDATAAKATPAGPAAPAAVQRKPTGRPSTFTEEIGERIAAEYAKGRRFSEILREDWAPDAQLTIVEWEEKYPSFAARMSRARVSHAEVLVDTMADVLVEERDPQRARILVDIRRFKAGKWSQRYAEKTTLEIEHRVSLGDALQAAQARLVRPVSDQQLIEDVEYEALPHVQPTTPTDGASDEAADAPDLPDFFD